MISADHILLSWVQERVLEELVACEHDEVCDVLKQRNKVIDSWTGLV